MNKAHLTGQVKALDDSTNPWGEFEVILSAPTLDRDGEIIDAKAFEPLPDHITFDVDHGMSTATTVGSGTPFYDGDVLKVRGTFASVPRAQEVRALVAEGHIRMTSVAYMGAKKTVKDGVPHITRAELLNGAFVAVPSNRDALVLSAKAGACHSAADGQRLQSIHDSLVELGVKCNVEHDEAPAEEVDEKTPDDAPEGEAAAPAPAAPPAAVAQARAEAASAEAEVLLMT